MRARWPKATGGFTDSFLDNPAYYDHYGLVYERKRKGPYHAILDEAALDLLAPLAFGKRILDGGCGPGHLLRAQEGSFLAGLDISWEMCRQAKEKGLSVVRGSLASLPFEDGAFDLLFCLKVLPHVEDLVGSLREISRVLAPGGHALLEFYNPHSIRSVVKRLFPRETGKGISERRVFTKEHTAKEIKNLLPGDLSMLRVRGVRTFLPAAFFLRIPLLGPLLLSLEWKAMDSPLRFFSGFLLFLVEKGKDRKE